MSALLHKELAMFRRILLALLLIFPQLFSSAEDTGIPPTDPKSGSGDRGPGMDPWG
jgi:hypothetical protein